MCYNCACSNPFDDMGNADNITEESWKDLAAQLKKSPEQTKKMVFGQIAGRLNHKAEDPKIEQLFIKAAKAWGQSVEEAKKNTFNLLKEQLKAE